MAWQYSDSWQGTNETFMKNNAKQFYLYFINKGYTLNAISAMLGNIQTESAINPHQKELPISTWTTDKGYGLVGWTPATKLINWLNNKSLDYRKGDSQCYFINSGDDGYGGSAWGNSYDPNAPSVVPPITWEEFKVSTLSAGTLAEYFMYYWEKPAYSSTVASREKRMTQALTWYEYLGGDPPVPPKPIKHRALPIYMMLRRI